MLGYHHIIYDFVRLFLVTDMTLIWKNASISESFLLAGRFGENDHRPSLLMHAALVSRSGLFAASAFAKSNPST